jgi:glycosyltransferase involved in cell wall biosynthesis
MEIQPKLSIITINLNNVIGLKKTIDSVICQTFTDYEFIIIDGSSTDDSVEIIKQYSKHIHYWISEPDSGIYNAMNKGILKAKGEYVIFMNSGDRFVNPDTLATVFSSKREADFIIGYTIRVWKHYTERTTVASKITFYHIVSNKALPHQATFTKRSLFDEIGLYDEYFKLAADRCFFYVAVFKHNKTVEIIPTEVAVMDVSGISNAKGGDLKVKKEEKEMLEKHFPYFYEDYKELYRIKRFTFTRIKNHLVWQVKKRLRY